MKWTNTIKNFKTLKKDLVLTVVSPVLTIVDILKVIPSGIRDIQEIAKNKEAAEKTCVTDTECEKV